MKKGPVFETACSHCQVRNQSVFHILEPEALSGLSEHKSCALFRKGQYVFTENGIPAGLYCVNSGKIKLTTTGMDGKEQILRLAKSGDILGYRAMIAQERYHCSAVALEDASICIIDKQYFFQQLETHPKLMFEVVKLLSRDLKTAESHIVSLSQKNVRERMAEALLFLKATYGFEADGKTLHVTLSREEMADYVGTSTESCIRLLSEFNADGLVSLQGKKIALEKMDALVRTAGLED